MKRSRLASLAVLVLLVGMAWVPPASAAAVPTQASICERFWGFCIDATNADEWECLEVYYACMSPE